MSDDIIEGSPKKNPEAKKQAPQLPYQDEVCYLLKILLNFLLQYKIEASHVRLTIIDDFEDNNTPVVDLFFNENAVKMSESTTKVFLFIWEDLICFFFVDKCFHFYERKLFQLSNSEMGASY